MGKWINKISIYFENCDGFDIAAKDLAQCYISGIHSHISRHGCNTICELEIADIIYLHILPRANEDYYEIGMEGKDDWKTQKFHRLLKYQDIVSITIYYDDGSQRDIYAKWGNDEDINTCERIRLSGKPESYKNGIKILIYNEDKDEYKPIIEDYNSDEDEEKLEQGIIEI